MTSLTDTQVVTASGGLVELGYGQSTSATTITSTSASSPTTIVSVTFVADGSPVLVEAFSPLVANVGTISVGDYCDWTLQQDGSPLLYVWWRGMANTTGYNQRGNYASYRYTPSAGSHTLTFGGVSQTAGSRWSVGGAGIGVAPTYLRVSKIVEATQWPAVTTGSIICTSSTRPASPFEGQQIYETDTDKQLVWNASAWKQMAGSSATFTDDLTVSGNLFRPNNPMFSASATVGTPGTWNTYVTPTANVGSHFNTTTGVFTTPTAGYYYFIATGFKEYSAAGPTQYYIGVNGVGYKRSYTDAPVNRYAATPGTNGIFYLNVGDAVSVIQTNGTMHTGANMHFSGWMIG